MPRKLAFVLVLTLALVLAARGHSIAAPAAQAELPPAPIVDDEGGPTRLVGSLDYTDFSIRIIMQNPAPALIDMVHIVLGDKTQFAPVESQILGAMTAPVFPPPLRYAFDLPAEPTATLLDVDNDGAADTGVQIFQLTVSANINGLSHLEQLDQATDTISYLADPTTGNITEGNLLVYAPDDQQGFPSGFGDDGILFTADDPAVGLPQGYTVVHFGPDGFTYDRAAEATLDLLPNPEAASPDFSDQGIVESFNSLIDHLALRYSFTELRQLDWEAIRAQYLPQVEKAEQLFATNPTAGAGLYGHLLHLLAQDVRDAHVTAVFNDRAYTNEFMAADALNRQPILTNLGANTVELSDGRIVVADVLPGSPAAEAGWTLGTEIVAVNGTPVADYLPTVVYNETLGTDEGQRLAQVNNLLKFPGKNGTEPVAEVTIDAILPGATAAQAFTLTPGQYALPDRLASLVTRDMAIQYKLAPGYGYLTWGGFENPEVDMAGLRQFLKEVKESPVPIDGIVLDLRGNGGGWDLLYFTMASYFFSAEQPVSMHWIDMDAFDPNVGDLVREAPHEYLLSAPDADLYYGGPLVVLVDQHCASSCEFFTQFLQTNDRATVVAQHASEGAGAPINRVAMPFGILFQYTKGRSYFAGTEELNLEGKGVVPDVRVPVTLESVADVMAGGDPVLAAGVNSLVPTATTIPCPMALPASEVEGKTVTCGQISVPEDWDNTAGKQIAITYAILHSKSQASFPDPVIYFDGGPGESSLESIAFLSSALSKLRATRDVILFDQRGALYSSNLECPLPVELGKTLEQHADEVVAAAAAPVKMPESEEELYALYSTRGDVQNMLAVAPLLQDPGPETRCGEYFRANDVDLSKYDSVANARDVIGLLQALGYPSYNLYGISYGTRLATVVMRLYQESQDAAALPMIRSVVIDGVMPTTLNQAAENPISEQLVALRVFADCEADAACGAAFPNIRQRAIDLLNQLSDAPIETGAGTTVTLADVTGMLTNLSSYHPRVAYLPLLIDELERGIDTTLQGLISGALPPSAAPKTAANPLDLIGGRATELAGMANQLGAALNDLAQQTQSLTDAVIAEQSLPEYFLNEAERLTLQRPQFGAELRDEFPELGKAAVSEPTRATIEAFIALYGDAQQRAILTSILNVMSEEDIRVTAAVLATEQARERFSHPLSNYMNHSVICNDSWGGLQDVQSFIDRFAATEAPQLIDANWINIWQVILYHQYCQSLQVTPAEMADQVQVASDIRTLVANGSLDALTPKEWGDLVFDSLTNAISTTIPYGGHGASAQTACGQDMVVAFVTYPDAPLDTSCTEALQPQWVLPN